IGSAAAAATGKKAVLQSVATATGGTYTITVSGAGTTGGYTVQVILNAAVEAESNDGPANNTLGTAQDLGPFLTLQTPQAGAGRGAVLGQFVAGEQDYYALSLAAGDSVSAAVTVKNYNPTTPFGAGGYEPFGSTPFHGFKQVVAGDVTGDGRADVVAVGYDSDQMIVLFGNGDGNFAYHPAFYSVLGSQTTGVARPTSVALGDINGGGRLDAVTANSGTNDVSLFLDNGGYLSYTPIRYSMGSQPSAVAIGDLNGDGRGDVIAVNYASNALVVRLGYGGANGPPLGAPASFSLGAGAAGPMGVVLGDFNGDGRLDV